MGSWSPTPHHRAKSKLPLRMTYLVQAPALPASCFRSPFPTLPLGLPEDKVIEKLVLIYYYPGIATALGPGEEREDWDE